MADKCYASDYARGDDAPRPSHARRGRAARSNTAAQEGSRPQRQATLRLGRWFGTGRALCTNTGELPPHLEDLDAVATAAEAEVAKEAEADVVRLPLVQYDEDEAADTEGRFTHTYTF